MRHISYGLYIVTSKKSNRFNGQVVNTLVQVANDPAVLAVSINKENLTKEFIADSRIFVASVLTEAAPISLIGKFGFKSGRQEDKLAGVEYDLSPGGVPYIIEETCSYMEVHVTEEVDVGSHIVFMGPVTGADVLREVTPMTYAYYHQVKRGIVPKTAPTFNSKEERSLAMDKYVCTVCGYVYDPAEGDPDNGVAPGTPFADVPEDWTCPLCGVGKDQFEKEN